MEPELETVAGCCPGIRLRCPTCAASIDLPGGASAARCDHCGTAHLLVGRTEVLTLALPDRIAGGTDAVRAFLEEMEARRLGELTVDRRRPDDPFDPLGSAISAALSRRLAALAGGLPDALHAAEAASWSARLAGETELVAHRRILTPYWHVSGRLVEAVVGRGARDEKQAAAATTDVELSAPAFEPGLALPPLGRLSWLSGLRPVAAAQLGGMRTLPLAADSSALEGRLRRVARQRLVRHLVPLLRHAVAFPRQWHLVLRPLHLLAARCRGRTLHLLLEGASRRVIERLTPAAFALLLEAPDSELPPELACPLALRPMRCPVCGWDLPLERFGEAGFCRGCGRAVAVEGEAATSVPYTVEVCDDADGAVLLPFWRFDFRLERGEGHGAAGSLGEVLELLAERSSTQLRKEGIDVPAFRPLDRRRAVPLCQPLFALSGRPGGRLIEGPVRGAMGFPYPERPVTVPASEARHLARTAMLLALPAAVLLRAPSARIERIVLQSHLELGTPRLVLRQFRRLDVEPLLGPSPGW